MKENVTYGIGGFNPEHPNGNVIERSTDDGDGTGLRTTYDEGGEETGSWPVTGLPLPEPESAPDPLAVIAAISDALATITPTSTSTQLRAALLATRTAIDTAIQGATP